MPSRTTKRRLAFLRDAAWLTPARASRACIALLFSNIAFVVLYLAIPQPGSASHWSGWFGADFWNFWASARLALRGEIAAVYDSATHVAALEELYAQIFGRSGGPTFMYPYPPPFLLLCAPFAALPYPLATAIWVLGGPTGLVAWLRRLLPGAGWMLPLVCFPGFFFNATCAQNACLSAACFAGGFQLSRQQPFLAGCALGLLSYKPQLLVVAPIALLAARRWRTLAGIAASATALCAASWIVFGTGAWEAFTRSILVSQANVEGGRIHLERVQTVFGLCRVLHAGKGLAYGIHAAVAIAALGGVVRVARRADPRALVALIVATTPLVPTYLMDYDLLLLVLPMAWVAAEASRTGWREWERTVLAAAFVAPEACWLLGARTHLPLGVVPALGLWWVVFARAGGAAAEGGHAAAARVAPSPGPLLYSRIGDD